MSARCAVESNRRDIQGRTGCPPPCALRDRESVGAVQVGMLAIASEDQSEDRRVQIVTVVVLSGKERGRSGEWSEVVLR